MNCEIEIERARPALEKAQQAANELDPKYTNFNIVTLQSLKLLRIRPIL